MNSTAWSIPDVRTFLVTLKHLGAILLLPCMATVIIPGVILLRVDSGNPGWSRSVAGQVLTISLGFSSLLIGILLVSSTINLFARFGSGTLAPWNPTRCLVVRGVYRYVRNPMISGVLGIIFGETLLSGSVALLSWFVVFLLGNVLYIRLVEEPGLLRRFGDEYEEYRRNVPRWLPRRTPRGDNT